MRSSQWAALPRDRFGDDPAMQDELAALVIAGRKTATCFAESAGPTPATGDRAVIENGSGQPVCVIETVALRRCPFDQVDEHHASNEGEGDLSLSYWRDVHRAYFTRQGTFSEDMMLVCENFRLVAVLTDPS